MWTEAKWNKKISSSGFIAEGFSRSSGIESSGQSPDLLDLYIH